MLPTISSQRGFTLIEMAIVLVILGFLLSGILQSLSLQADAQAYNKTRTALDNAKEALLGFVMTNGRLPCPATSISAGFEAPLGGGTCTSASGYLPAATLNITPVDNNGYALDGWSSNPSNRLRYVVSTTNANMFTTSINNLDAIPDLKVCSSADGISGSSCGTNITLANSPVAVIVSLGKNAGTGGISSDEAENLDGDKLFIAHAPSVTPVFDDQVTWLSYPILAGRLVAVGKLP